ncbi:hypothetical protein [Enterococcus rivorum]|uniref:Uncharacterized protein n=1 Tax=Enterococcus rivorum TaxID=762845 RepID=A0A1E5L0E8_9ENTE|nr:hypothetical protein [Enterococcus rivorum]MBP2098859.1 hypothetical protein [Enterococcus rivorum]OEH83588.1 hypothetical protein BCR26_08910 [Enterococcus rivorum]
MVKVNIDWIDFSNNWKVPKTTFGLENELEKMRNQHANEVIKENKLEKSGIKSLLTLYSKSYLK